jgi:heat-inducible transcriptional repressor
VSLTMIMNERLAGQSLWEIRNTLPERLGDVVPPGEAGQALLNIFLQSGEDFFDLREASAGELHLGRTSVLANQPEFASGSQLRSLIELTEERDLLKGVLSERAHHHPLMITIGTEHERPELSPFTLVTSGYQIGGLSGVIGVIGPTRMPYEKVAAIVESTSHLVSEIMGGEAGSGE